ncbi:DNA primase [Lewinellaceae bacterium SD302]|nr:DNA primase [Lewinellaceae bacterium SD302]
MILEESVREVIDTARIEDVVGDFVSLKRRGQNLTGLCPFHNENTPSFNVNPARNIYKCFGCGVGGDPVKFLIELEQISFPDAIKWLARRYNIKLKEKELTDEQQVVFKEKESLYLVNEFARQWYEQQLYETDEGKSVGLSYFKGRGFREEVMRKFGLGYAPNSRDAFTRKALATGYKKDQLQKLGLSRNGRDFFYDRVMFTIHNLTGKPIAFAGRILKKDAKAPKYVNSPETEIYHKSNVLYGMFQAKQSIRKLDNVYLVEGYTDVISLAQHGVENVVASSGTSLTPGQVSLIKRFTDNVTLLYDGDKAGIKAALRGVDILLDQDMTVRCVRLPEGEDPDSYLQSVGTTAFVDYLTKQRQDFMIFKAKLLLDESGNDLGGKTAVIQNLAESLARINQPLKRAEYIKQLAELIGVQENLLVGQINKAVGSRQKQLQQDAQRNEWKARRERPQPPPAPGPDSGGADPGPQAPPATHGDEGWPGAEPGWYGDEQAGMDPGAPPPDFFPGAPPPPVEEPLEEELAIGHTYQERYLAILLMRDGAKLYDEATNSTIAQFLLVNVQDVLDDFDSPFYRLVVEDARNYFQEKGKPADLDYYLAHADQKVRKLAVDSSISRYTMSPNWVSKYGKYLSQKLPEENQRAAADSFIRIFRQEKLQRKIDQNMRKIRELQSAGQHEELIPYLKLQSELIKLKNQTLGENMQKFTPPKYY